MALTWKIAGVTLAVALGACGERTRERANGGGGESAAAGRGGSGWSGGSGSSGGSSAGSAGAMGGSAASGSGTGASGSGCGAVREKLASCALLNGTVDCAGADEDAAASCRFDCYRTATCDEIEDGLCAFMPNRFASCRVRCNEFECADGTRILSSWQCDGMQDCPSGDDEAGCVGPSQCSDGSGLPETWSCDGFPDCPDGGDEAGCGFRCTSGESIANERVCDLTTDCADGSDELACAELACRSDPLPL